MAAPGGSRDVRDGVVVRLDVLEGQLRIDGNGHHAGELRAEEREDELFPVGDGERDAIALREAERRQGRRAPGRLDRDVVERTQALAAVGADEHEAALGVPCEGAHGVDQRGRDLTGQGHDRWGRKGARGRSRAMAGATWGNLAGAGGLPKSKEPARTEARRRRDTPRSAQLQEIAGAKRGSCAKGDSRRATLLVCTGRR